MTSLADESGIHDFGVVAEHGDSVEFHIDGAAGERCRLVAVVQTERGPRRTELADIEGATWRKISARAVRELAQDMGEAEITGKRAPTLKTGANRLSPLVGRELALLLWAIQEEGAIEQLEAGLRNPGLSPNQEAQLRARLKQFRAEAIALDLPVPKRASP